MEEGSLDSRRQRLPNFVSNPRWSETAPTQTTGKTLRASGWAMLDAKGRILLRSIRDKPDEVRLAGGEGRVYPVTVFLEKEDVQQ